MWLRRDACSVKDGYLYVMSGYKARVIGMEERYKEDKWKEAKLVYRGCGVHLYIAAEIPRPTPVEPRGVIAVDINERYVYYGNAQWIRKVETPIERTVRLRSDS